MATTDRLRTPFAERGRGIEASERSLNSRELLIKRRMEALKKAFDALDGGNKEVFKDQLDRSKDFGKVIKEMEDFEQIFLKAKTGQK